MSASMVYIRTLCKSVGICCLIDDLRDQAALVSAAAWQRAPTWHEEAAEHEVILASASATMSPGGAASRALVRSFHSSTVGVNLTGLDWAKPTFSVCCWLSGGGSVAPWGEWSMATANWYRPGCTLSAGWVNVAV